MDLFFRYCGVTPRLQGQKYSCLENSGAPRQAHTLEEFQTIVLPMLLAVGPYASVDPVLLYKVIRIAKTALKIVSPFFSPNSLKITQGSFCCNAKRIKNSPNVFRGMSLGKCN